MSDKRSEAPATGFELQIASLPPHPIHIVDGTLPGTIGPYMSRVVFGFVPPGSQSMLPAVTVVGSTESLYQIAKLLIKDIEQRAPQIKAEYERFAGSIASPAPATHEASEPPKVRVTLGRAPR